MLKNVIEKASEESSPWPWYGLSDVLDEEQVAEIRAMQFNERERMHGGKRSDNTSVRQFVTENGPPGLRRLVEELLSKEVQEAIHKKIYKYDGNYSGLYVRMEVLNDKDGFWLEPHCDIGEKLISCLVYVNETDEDENIGTDLYTDMRGWFLCGSEDSLLEPVRTVPFIHNTGYMFSQFDGNGNKVHGLSKGKKIKVERRGLQINYVTFETPWRVYE